MIGRFKGKVPRLKLIAADHGFVTHLEVAGYKTEIVRGHPVKSQKVAGALSLKKTAGQ